MNINEYIDFLSTNKEANDFNFSLDFQINSEFDNPFSIDKEISERVDGKTKFIRETIREIKSCTALHMAVINNNISVVKKLVDMGANVKATCSLQEREYEAAKRKKKGFWVDADYCGNKYLSTASVHYTPRELAELLDNDVVQYLPSETSTEDSSTSLSYKG